MAIGSYNYICLITIVEWNCTFLHLQANELNNDHLNQAIEKMFSVYNYINVCLQHNDQGKYQHSSYTPLS